MRGHATVGGNERVDALAKYFARNQPNLDFTFAPTFPSSISSSHWSYFPLFSAPLASLRFLLLLLTVQTKVMSHEG